MITHLVDILQMVSGLDDEIAKTCVYYALITHHLDFYTFVPILESYGPLGTGKTQLEEFMERVCYLAHICKCGGITYAALREELYKAKKGTFIGDEVDCDVKKVEDLYGIRCSASGSAPLMKSQGKSQWQGETIPIFGATVLHHRRPFLDPSNQSRAITIKTHWKPGKYIKMEAFKDVPIEIPQIPVGNISNTLSLGRAYDTWYPLLDMATGAGDTEWLAWADKKMKESEKEVNEGQAYEPNAVILAKLIEACVDSDSSKIKSDIDRVNVHSQIVAPLTKEYPWVNSHSVPRILRELGLEIHRTGGNNWVYPTPESLKKAAEAIGYTDGVFE